eukprot:GHVP01053835.1.p1 GENE.GHVP01053835.1~~GHVP01053835.1.p1  ORF type:complete len:185 (+),score=19.96 GHVP01053835.1:120-674(+)
MSNNEELFMKEARDYLEALRKTQEHDPLMYTTVNFVPYINKRIWLPLYMNINELSFPVGNIGFSNIARNILQQCGVSLTTNIQKDLALLEESTDDSISQFQRYVNLPHRVLNSHIHALLFTAAFQNILGYLLYIQQHFKKEEYRRFDKKIRENQNIRFFFESGVNIKYAGIQKMDNLEYYFDSE